MTINIATLLLKKMDFFVVVFSVEGIDT